MSGIHATCKPDGGVSIPQVGLIIELKQGSSTWRYTENPLEEEEGGTRILPVALTPEDTLEKLDVWARTAESGNYEWTLELTVDDESGEHVITVDDNGKPFKTTSADNAPGQEWDGAAWVPSDFPSRE